MIHFVNISNHSIVNRVETALVESTVNPPAMHLEHKEEIEDVLTKKRAQTDIHKDEFSPGLAFGEDRENNDACNVDAGIHDEGRLRDRDQEGVWIQSRVRSIRCEHHSDCTDNRDDYAQNVALSKPLPEHERGEDAVRHERKLDESD